MRFDHAPEHSVKTLQKPFWLRSHSRDEHFVRGMALQSVHRMVHLSFHMMLHLMLRRHASARCAVCIITGTYIHMSADGGECISMLFRCCFPSRCCFGASEDEDDSDVAYSHHHYHRHNHNHHNNHHHYHHHGHHHRYRHRHRHRYNRRTWSSSPLP